MPHESTIFRFAPSVSMHDVEQTLHLANLAVASLHGEDRVRMQVTTSVNAARRTCEIDTNSEVGQALTLIFGGYVRREFGDDAVSVQRVTSMKGSAQEILT